MGRFAVVVSESCVGWYGGVCRFFILYPMSACCLFVTIGAVLSLAVEERFFGTVWIDVVAREGICGKEPAIECLLRTVAT